MSSDDSDSSDDPFTFQKHSFGARRKRTYSDSSSTSSKSNSKQETTTANVAISNHIDKKQETCIELSSDEDNKILEIDDDDSSIEEDINNIDIKRRAMENNEGYRRAQEAMEALKKAQVNQPSMDIYNVDSSSESSIEPIASQTKDNDDDDVMEIVDNTTTIIITTTINGDTTTSHDWQLKRTDPISKLVQVYESKHNVQIDKMFWRQFNKQIFFDETPNMLHMTHRVTIDLMIQNARHTTLNNSKTISLKLRTNGNEKHIQSYDVLPTDPFSVLMDLFLEQNRNIARGDAVFMLDGFALSLDGTPENEDLEGGEIIEVQVK